MFLIRNGKLEKYNIRFALPDGFYLVTEPEIMSEEEISFTDDGNLTFSIVCEHIEESLKEDLFKLYVSGKYRNGSEPEQHTINGMVAYSMYYENSKHYYYEIHMAKTDVFNSSKLVIYLGIPKEDNINLKDIVESDNMKNFINSVEYIED